MIILDTNVLSEALRPAPSEQVLRWMGKVPAASFYTTAITQAEIFAGLAMMPEGVRKASLITAATALLEIDLASRVLPFDSDAARQYPEIAVTRSRLGLPSSSFDLQIAAIARSRGAALATRNTGDFEHCGIEVVNPWVDW